MAKINVKEIEQAEAQVLKWLPEKERDVAKRIIYKATKLGFTSIGLWGSMDIDGNPLEADIHDLVGNDPNGKLTFLYGKI